MERRNSDADHKHLPFSYFLCNWVGIRDILLLSHVFTSDLQACTGKPEISPAHFKDPWIFCKTEVYGKLSRIYHPDANINNPNKDQAEAKFKEIQQAYQQIMKEKEMGASGYTGTGSGGYGDAGSGYGGFGGFGPFGGFYGQYTNQNQQTTETEEDIHLRAAANYLNSGHYKEALNVLSGIKDRSARWYYYSSIANSGMGNNVLALEHAKEALRLEPSNYQYQSLVSRLENGGSWYRTQQTMYGGTPTINNDFCVKLCIANIMCNLCCGGGGFFCGSPYTYH